MPTLLSSSISTYLNIKVCFLIVHTSICAICNLHLWDVNVRSDHRLNDFTFLQNFKVSTALLKQGVVCVNVSQFRNFEDDVKDRASMYVRAVGKVTNAMLLRNLVRLHGHQRKLVNHDPYQLTPAAVSQQQP